MEDLLKGVSDINEDDLNVILLLSFSSFFVFAALAKFKFHYANVLHSPSLRKDGLCSSIGAVLAFAMFFNAMLTVSSENGDLWWWLDPSVALICALVALAYGLFGMYKAYVLDGYPIFSPSWWLYGGGGGRREIQVIQNHSEHVKRSQQQQQQNSEGDLELQQSNTSLAGNPSMNSSSSLSMMKSKSGDEDMSDVVIT